ncbi:MAG: pantetheine-phosphate adenylyltransferase [Bacteroidales bacterium]|jgi:pantetheine-phosphate adenylyltransferase|nr:pantetheine-phosphate adenylyltransferase [Bacteroidales bacterium]MDD4771843.1 pantetheine-phosphate adenylyltransferase [Bacteroidales bacterium]HKL92685.1 pantetheine-phosphate adenylyltransferase [Bacteroidales bacterium]
MKQALFPGTFDPFTLGHEAIVRRGLALFDRVVIAIGNNSTKTNRFTAEERRLQVQSCFSDDPSVEVCLYEGLTADFANERSIPFLLRGVRTVNDFEYERLLADANHKIAGLETILLFTEPEYAFIQSSVVRDLLRYGKDVSAFLPATIVERLKQINV